jgi:hypothetical protein
MRHFFCISASLASGCTALPSTYNPESLPSDQLASVSPYGEYSIFERYDVAEITGVFDRNKKKVIDKDLNTIHEKVMLPEGNYHFIVSCNTANAYAITQTSAHLGTGENYTIFCERILVDDGYGGPKLRGYNARIVNSKEFNADMIDEILVDEMRP